MQAIKHILFPIDFSERCNAAAPFVAFMAKKFGAKVTLVNVVQPYWYSVIPEGPILVDLEEIRTNIEDGLSQTYVKELAGVQVDRVVQVGDPAAAIKQFGETNAVDMIMMPTHGYGPFRRLLLGSIAAKVLHDCKLPVWTGAHMEDPAHARPIGLQKILCAVDATEASKTLLQSAVRVAADAGAGLRLLHVIPQPGSLTERQMDRQFEAELSKDARQQIESMKASVGVKAPLSIVAGESVASVVRREAEKDSDDLVIIGRGNPEAFLGRLRTNAHAIIRESPCPVLSI